MTTKTMQLNEYATSSKILASNGQEKKAADIFRTNMDFPPLPRRTSPLPWEDSTSFISRVSQVMGYEHPIFLLAPESLAYKLSVREFPMIYRKQDYSVLQQLFCLDEETLYQLTLHQFTSAWPQLTLDHSLSGSIERPLLDQQVLPRLFLSLTMTRVCPRCLQENDAYSRLFWRLYSLYLCPTHATFLIDRCSTCHKHIPALRPVITHCPFCSQGDYREISTYTPVEGSPLHIGQLFWLYHHELKYLLPRHCLPLLNVSPLVILSVVQYEHLFFAFRQLVSKAYEQQEQLVISLALQALPRDIVPFLPRLSHQLVWKALFHFCFLSWPENLFVFLDLLYQTSMLKKDERYVQILCNEFFYNPDLADPAFYFLHQAYAIYNNTRDQLHLKENVIKAPLTTDNAYTRDSGNMSWIQYLHTKYGYFHHRIEK